MKIHDVVSVVQLDRRPIDKIAAQVLVEVRRGELAVEDTFSSELTDEELDRLEEYGILPIDLGSEKYNKGGWLMFASEEMARAIADAQDLVRQIVGYRVLLTGSASGLKLRLPRFLEGDEEAKRDKVCDALRSHFRDLRLIGASRARTIRGKEKNPSQALSATEYVAEKLDLQLSAAERRLLQLMSNNNDTGDLKGYHASMAWTIREIYEIPGNVPEQLADRLKKAVRIYLDAEELGEEKGAFYDVRLAYPELSDLAEFTETCNDAPFTPGRLLRDMNRLSVSPAVIREEVEFWVNQWGDLRHRIVEIREQFKEHGLPEGAAWFDVPRPGQRTLKGVAVQTDDRLLVKVLAKHCDVLIVRNSDRHSLVSARGFENSGFKGMLQALEPGVWHAAHPDYGMTGGPMYRSKRGTVLSIKNLVDIIAKRQPPQGDPFPERAEGNN